MVANSAHSREPLWRRGLPRLNPSANPSSHDAMFAAARRGKPRLYRKITSLRRRLAPDYKNNKTAVPVTCREIPSAMVETESKR